MAEIEIDDFTAPSAKDVAEYLRNTRNELIGNPTNKLHLLDAEDDGHPLLYRIVKYVYSDPRDFEPFFATETKSVVTQIRIEAANIIVSLAHGSNDLLLALINAEAPEAILRSVVTLNARDPDRLKVAIIRAFRAICVASADCMGASPWGLGEDVSEYRKGVQLAIEPLFLTDSLDACLPYLDSSSSLCRQYMIEFIAFAVRSPSHQRAVIEWLPGDKRIKEGKGKRGWENPALLDATSPSWQGGWVLRHLIASLDGKELPALREATLYALGALARENQEISLILSKVPDNQSVLTRVSSLSKDRNTAIRIAACSCVTSILRSLPPGSHRRLSTTTIQILNSVISDTSERVEYRIKACHILGNLVTDDNDRCTDAWRSGSLAKLAELLTSITPTTKPQEWDDGESIDTSRLREAALIALASMLLFNNDMRNEAAGKHGLFPHISVCVQHPYVGVRYGACMCARSLSRSVRVLRTNLFDSGISTSVCDVVNNQDEDMRVTNIALGTFANLANSFSPLRDSTAQRDLIKRIAELSSSPESAIRTGALCAIRNVIIGAKLDERERIISQLGWRHLQACLSDPAHDAQEQAIAIITNLATKEESYIDLIFKNLSGQELIADLARCLESRHDGVVHQTVEALGNISNGAERHYTFILNSTELLSGLRLCVAHSNLDIRKVALACTKQLARHAPEKIRQAGFAETLQRICRETFKPAGPADEIFEARRRYGMHVNVGLDDATEASEEARVILRIIDGSRDLM